MEIPKLMILLCCTCSSLASHSHTIPVEGYKTELQDLGQHVDHHETPVKVIKITKTIAVKVPVPYPVKVIQKVPYPVHVSKPYPVPVPQIVKVPHPIPSKPTAGGHDSSDLGNDGFHADEGTYQVQDTSTHDSPGQDYSYGYSPDNSYRGGVTIHSKNIESFIEQYPSDEAAHGQSYGSTGSSLDSPSHSYYGSPSGDSFESKSYDQAIQNYLSKNKPNGVYTGSYGYDSH